MSTLPVYTCRDYRDNIHQIMTSIRSFLLLILPLSLLVAVPASADAIFNFENVAVGTAAPFTSTVNGLTASFSGPATVCNVTPLNFATLSGNSLIQGFFPCSSLALGPISIGFSSNLSSISFNFATGSRPTAAMTLQAFENSALVGTTVFNSSAPPGNFPNGEGLAAFSGTFNNIVLSTAFTLAVDNINATTATTGVPEPASLSMLAAGGMILAGLARRARKRQAS